jgi:hypothetical protein
MSYYGSWKIDDLLTFCVNTHRFDTGAATDADAVPSYRIYEDETSTPILTGNMALLDSANTAGFYSEQITLSAANGFEKGKSYTIYITATVNSVAATTHHNFQIEAEVDANTISPAIPWNAAWDAEVQSEVQDALVANNLDHLVLSAVDTDFATTVHLDSVIGHLADGGGTATFDRTTDSLEVNRDQVALAISYADQINATTATIEDAVVTEVAEIKAKTDQMVFTTANRLDVQVYGMESGVVTAASIAADAITDAKVAADVTIASVTGAVGSVTGNVGGNVTGSVASVTGNVGGTVNGLTATAQANVRTAVGLASANLDTQLSTIDDFLDTEVAAVLAAVDTEVAAIKTKTDQLTFTVANQVDANALTGGGGGGLDAAGVRAAVGLASANLDTQLTAIDDFIDTEIGTLVTAVAAVQTSVNTVDDLLDTEIPALTAAVAALPTAAGIADAVFDEALSGHTTAGTFGKWIADVDVTEPWVDVTVEASPAPTTTTFAGQSGLSSADDFYNGAALAFTSGSLQGLTRRITDYTGATRLFTLESALPSAPASGVTAKVIGQLPEA